MLLIKKLRLGLHLARGLLVALLIFPFLSEAAKHRRIRLWSQKLLRLCGMRLEVEQHAPLPESGVMLLCNHVSWIDIFAINAWRPVRFVAKAEIRHWPLVGWLCVQTRTIFLQRERRADAPVPEAPRAVRMRSLSDAPLDGSGLGLFTPAE